MKDLIKQFFRELFCGHDWETIDFVFGWGIKNKHICKKCGKVSYW